MSTTNIFLCTCNDILYMYSLICAHTLIYSGLFLHIPTWPIHNYVYFAHQFAEDESENIRTLCCAE